MKKTTVKLLFGIISSVALMAFLFYLFIFLNPFRIYNSNMLKWVPILICIVSMYASGIINRKTSLILLPFLFIPFIIYKLFNYTYFPFVLVLILAGILTLLITRHNQNTRLKWLAISANTVILIYYLLSQPLILLKDNFKYGDFGELLNVNVIWDFSEEQNIPLPNHNLNKRDNSSINLSSLKGKTCFITFWATWCKGCMAEKPDLELLKNEYAEKKEFEFIDVSFDDNHDKWIKFLDDKQPKGMQLIADSQRETSRLLDFAGIPMHIVVTPDGNYKKYESFEVAKNVFTKATKK